MVPEPLAVAHATTARDQPMAPARSAWSWARAPSSPAGLSKRCALAFQDLVGADHDQPGMAGRDRAAPSARPAPRRLARPRSFARHRTSLTAASSTAAGSTRMSSTRRLQQRAPRLAGRGEHDGHGSRRVMSAVSRAAGGAALFAQQLEDRRGGLLDRAAGHIDHRPAVLACRAGGPGPPPRARHRRST